MKNLILTSSLWMGFIFNGFAYQPTGKDLSHFIQKQYKHLKRATIDLEVKMFTEERQPVAKYQRIVYWTSQFRAMKTFNASKKLIDFYYEGHGISIRSQKKSIPDDVPIILPPYLRLVYPKQMNQNLDILQIKGRETSLFSHATDGAFFKIGNERNYVLIDPQTLLPAQVIYGIWQDHQIQTIKIKFSNLVQSKIRYPRQTDYFYNDFLFQRITLKYISTKKKIPATQLQKQAKQLLQTRLLPFDMDYTQ